jgi:hypothetical protein
MESIWWCCHGSGSCYAIFLDWGFVGELDKIELLLNASTPSCGHDG